MCFVAPSASSLPAVCLPRAVPTSHPSLARCCCLPPALQAGELERARLDHQAALAERQALEAQHSLRDDWMEVLRLVGGAQRGEQGQQGQQGQPLDALAVAAGTSAVASAEGPHAAQQLAAWLESVAGSSARAAAEGRWVPTLAGDIAAALRASPSLLATVGAVTPAQLVAMWDSLLAQLAELLATVEASGCKSAERQLVSLMIESVSGPAASELQFAALPPPPPAPAAHPSQPLLPPPTASTCLQCLFFDLVTLLRPAHFKLFMAARGVAPGGSPRAQWGEVVAALRLTPAQRRGLTAEWHAFKARQAELAAAASAAAARVAAAAAAPVPQCAADGQPAGAAPTAAAAAVESAAPPASLMAVVEHYMRLAEGTGELAAAADARWASLLAYSDAAWYRLTPLQGARLLAACRPFYPDPIQIGMALEQAEAEAEAAAEAEAEGEAEAAAAGGSEVPASGSQPPRTLLEAAQEGGSGDGLAAAEAHCWRLGQPAAAQQGGSGGAPSGQLASILLSGAGPK